CCAPRKRRALHEAVPRATRPRSTPRGSADSGRVGVSLNERIAHCPRVLNHLPFLFSPSLELARERGLGGEVLPSEQLRQIGAAEQDLLGAVAFWNEETLTGDARAHERADEEQAPDRTEQERNAHAVLLPEAREKSKPERARHEDRKQQV